MWNPTILVLPQLPTTTTTPPPHFYRAKGGERKFFAGQRKVGRKSLRNSVILSFMLIHFSTENLSRGITSLMQAARGLHSHRQY